MLSETNNRRWLAACRRTRELRERARQLMAAAIEHATAGERFTPARDDAVRAAHAYAFQVATKRYPTAPVGDALAVSTAMRTKYGPKLAACRV